MLLPPEFIQQTKLLLGNDWQAFESSLQETPPTSIRINNKININPALEKVAWCKQGYYLPTRPQFTFDPLFHAGTYYVQEAASMFIEQAVRQQIKTPVCALDLCAAPGGKSTLLSSALPEGSLLVANEIIRQRAYILSENLQKWGKSNTVTTCNTPSEIGSFGAFFDFMLVDAPCSGEGMFRKDSASINEWSLNNVQMCVKRQREILLNSWCALKKNGILLYSTCTYNRQENEENVFWICEKLGAEILKIETEKKWNITESEAGYQFFPHLTKGEGFFLSVLRKTKTEHPAKTKIKQKTPKINPPSFRKFLKNEEQYSFLQQEATCWAVKKELEEQITILQKKLHILHAGVVLSQEKGKDSIPQAGLALSCDLDHENVPKQEVNYETAIAFLRKENIFIPNVPKGYLLISYKNSPIGWVKNIGSRSNNLYPQEWRIRSQQTPKEPILIF